MSTTSVGRKGEELAGSFLVNQGFVLLAKNMRNAGGEIDLILEQGELIVFAEVKLRKNAYFAHGSEHIGLKKQRRYIDAASLWLAANRPDSQARFDVLEIYGDVFSPDNITINHIPNAFSGDDGVI